MRLDVEGQSAIGLLKQSRGSAPEGTGRAWRHGRKEWMPADDASTPSLHDDAGDASESSYDSDDAEFGSAQSHATRSSVVGSLESNTGSGQVGSLLSSDGSLSSSVQFGTAVGSGRSSTRSLSPRSRFIDFHDEGLNERLLAPPNAAELSHARSPVPCCAECVRCCCSVERLLCMAAMLIVPALLVWRMLVVNRHQTPGAGSGSV